MIAFARMFISNPIMQSPSSRGGGCIHPTYSATNVVTLVQFQAPPWFTPPRATKLGLPLAKKTEEKILWLRVCHKTHLRTFSGFSNWFHQCLKLWRIRNIFPISSSQLTPLISIHVTDLCSYIWVFDTYTILIWKNIFLTGLPDTQIL